MEKKLHKSAEADLINNRKEQLRSLNDRDLQGLGKRSGMDVFSWPNPHFDKLSTMINSFPYPVIWIGMHEQIRCTLTYYPETAEKIEAGLIYDTAEINFKQEVLKSVKTLIATGSVESALLAKNNWSGKKMILLFSTEGQRAQDDMQEFERLI
jgi:hypothetical protein